MLESGHIHVHEVEKHQSICFLLETEMYSSTGDPRRYSYACDGTQIYSVGGWGLMTPTSPPVDRGYFAGAFVPSSPMPNYGFQSPNSYGSLISPPTQPMFRQNIFEDYNPRYIEDLRTERTYLLNTLRIENERARELLNRVPLLECGVVDNQVPQMRRKMRKQLGWIRHRLNETNQQEQAIMARLGQLMEQIRLAENRRIQMEMESFNFQCMHDTAVNNMQSLHLDPRTPHFHPEGGYPFPVITEVVENDSYNDGAGPSDEPPPQKDDGHNNSIDETSSALTKEEKELIVHGTVGGSEHVINKRPDLSQRSSSISIEERLFDDGFGGEQIQEQRRHSLPTLPGVSQIWAPLESERRDMMEE
ncbi:hypothetical protein GLAREA_10534 [Glarea lozoyensis ATCC 20868]|uniref:Uncharacterized protein n=1 Tax=Glarea lozoyensis (strain ATCC 20868 / MF5171) TaxID=1116229 RepID=S3DCP7_GLAL2|nr:uncharacterized protein GLAREA_10534 [Glarea lozoyensis ATCC 20868]EPE34839.1 hypothetical protein GLAREA_10534 [Glarea lozoyensis ATCC 20868]